MKDEGNLGSDNILLLLFPLKQVFASWSLSCYRYFSSASWVMTCLCSLELICRHWWWLKWETINSQSRRQSPTDKQTNEWRETRRDGLGGRNSWQSLLFIINEDCWVQDWEEEENCWRKLLKKRDELKTKKKQQDVLSVLFFVIFTLLVSQEQYLFFLLLLR